VQVDIRQTLEQNREEYKALWQKIPDLVKLEEPFPLRSILSIYKGVHSDQNSSHFSFDRALKATLDKGLRILTVEGSAGQGKSSSLIWEAYRLAGEFLE
jgi:hypothetical protein